MSADTREMYRAKGWRIFPLKSNDKEPIAGHSWTKEYKGDWEDTYNLAVATGKVSGDLVDFDGDWPEVGGWATIVFGRNKTAVFGRDSKPGSHCLFKTKLKTKIVFKLPQSFLALNVPDEHSLTVAELRGDGCYTMFPPSIHPSGERVKWQNDVPVVAMDAETLRKYAGLIAFLTVCERFWPDNGRHDAALTLSGILYWAGWPQDIAELVIKTICERDEQLKDRLRAVADTYSDSRGKSGWKAFRKAFHFPEDSIQVFADWLEMRGALIAEELNQKFAVIRDGSKVRIGTESYDPLMKRRWWDLMTVGDFTLYMRLSEMAKIWLQHPDRREYLNGFIFDPSGTEHDGYLNLWKGWAIEPKPGDWSLLHAHICDVLADGDKELGDYILRWFAWMYQNPDKQAEVAIVFRGKKGTGKGSLGHAHMLAAGQHAIQVSQPSQVTGKFNAHMRDCIFLWADEGFWAGDKQGEGQFKRIITERTLAVEAKFRDVAGALNMLHIMISSNEDWVVPATLDERRFVVIDVPDAKIGDEAYFKALHHEIGNGGVAAMLHDLLSMDLGKWHPRQTVYTAALSEQVRQSEPPEKAVLRRLLSIGQLPGTIAKYGSEPNELLFPEFRKLLDQEPFGRGVTSAKAGRYLKSIPKAWRDNNGRQYNGTDYDLQPQISRCQRYLMPPLKDLREWFDPNEEWDEPFEWEHFDSSPGLVVHNKF